MTDRVVLLTTNLAHGGAETQVAHLALGLRARGWEVSVISLLPLSAFEKELVSSGVGVFSLAMQPGRPSLGGLVRMALLLRRLRPQVLHGHMFHANLLARTIRAVCPVPVVVSTVHSLMDISRDSADPRLRDWIYRVTDPLSEVTIAVCEAGAERSVSAKLAPRRKLRVIYNGVDTERFHPDDELRGNVRAGLGTGDEFVWLAVGRLMWKKGYENMIEAFARQDKGLLLIAGEGEQEAELRSLTEKTGANVRFLGFRRDVPELMNAADAFLLSSVVEGLPLVLLEAGACGLPCVATDVGGVREIVLDGSNGYVAPAGDPKELARRIASMMSLTAAERRQMGSIARQRAVTHFDLKAVAEHWDQLYRELLDTAGARAGTAAAAASPENAP